MRTACGTSSIHLDRIQNGSIKRTVITFEAKSLVIQVGEETAYKASELDGKRG